MCRNLCVEFSWETSTRKTEMEMDLTIGGGWEINGTKRKNSPVPGLMLAVFNLQGKLLKIINLIPKMAVFFRYCTIKSGRSLSRASIITLVIMGANTPETSMKSCQTTQRNIKDNHLHTFCREI